MLGKLGKVLKKKGLEMSFRTPMDNKDMNITTRVTL